MSARSKKVSELRRWCLDLAVDAYSKSILHALIQYVDEDGECWPSVARIARESGMCRRKAGYVIRVLAEAGIVDVEWSAGRSPHRYRLDANRAPRTPLNCADRAGFNEPNRARKAQLNHARGAQCEYANRARQDIQPRTACALLVSTGIKETGQGRNSSEQSGGDELRKVAS